MYRCFGRAFWELARDKPEDVARKGKPGDSLLWRGLSPQRARQALAELRELLARRRKVKLTALRIADGWHLVPREVQPALPLLCKLAAALWQGQLPTVMSPFSDLLQEYGYYSRRFERAIFRSCARAGSLACARLPKLSKLQRSLLRYAGAAHGGSGMALRGYRRPPGCSAQALSRALRRLEDRGLISLLRTPGGRVNAIRLTLAGSVWAAEGRNRNG